MSDVVDFVQMPWSPTPASWRHHNLEAWKALEVAVSDGRSLTLSFPASGNSHLEGTLTVRGIRFTASVVIRSEASPPEDEIAQVLRASGFLNNQTVDYTVDADSSVTVTLRSKVREKGESGVKPLLMQLQDLQLLVVRLLCGAYGVRQTPPYVEAQPDPVRTLD